MMPLKFVNKKNQSFDLGRTINFMVCTECKSDFTTCDSFMNCPKNNYSPEQTVYRYTLQEFKSFYGDKLNDEWYKDSEIFDDFINLFEFPETIYYLLNDKELKLLSTNDEEWDYYYIIDLSNGIIYANPEIENMPFEIQFSKDLKEFAEKISQALMELR